MTPYNKIQEKRKSVLDKFISEEIERFKGIFDSYLDAAFIEGRKSICITVNSATVNEITKLLCEYGYTKIRVHAKLNDHLKDIEVYI
jgi:hypothetical protein